jgi:hypothetical protein
MTPEETMMVESLTNPADVFNYVVGHLRKQGCQSLQEGEDGGCAYRGDGGTMCAVGCLITDDEYDPRWEGDGIYHLITGECSPPALKKRLEPNCKMLMDLQEFHDDHLEYVDGAFVGASEHHINNLREKWGIR